MAMHATPMSMYGIRALPLSLLSSPPSVLESPFSWTPSSLSLSHVESVSLSPFRPPTDGRNYRAVTK